MHGRPRPHGRLQCERKIARAHLLVPLPLIKSEYAQDELSLPCHVCQFWRIFRLGKTLWYCLLCVLADIVHVVVGSFLSTPCLLLKIGLQPALQVAEAWCADALIFMCFNMLMRKP